MTRSALIGSVACLLVTGAVAESYAKAPPVFSSLPFDKAKSKATEERKLLVLYFTAYWCGPCVMMNRNTWVDEQVTAWIAENAIALYIDTDRQRSVALAFRATALPTVVIIRDGVEYDRRIGYRPPERLLAWLDAVHVVTGSDPDAQVDVEENSKLAKRLADDGRLDEAAQQYVGLWEHMLRFKPSEVPVRLPFMAASMKKLADRHRPAKERFGKMRDRAEIRLQGQGRTTGDLIAWFVLNEVVAEESKTLEWFDLVKDHPLLDQAMNKAEHLIEELLFRRERWADLARIYGDPVEDLSRQKALWNRPVNPELPEAERQRIARFQIKGFRKAAGRIYATCLANGWEEEALKVAERSVEEAGDVQVTRVLIATALEASQARAHQVDWLKELAEAGEPVQNLRDRVTAALADGNGAGAAR